MLNNENGMFVAFSDRPILIEKKMANRHGLISGATGTGKTVSLQLLAETFSQAGISCFMADMKGDLSGVSQAGTPNKFIETRKTEFGIDDIPFQGFPVRFFDVFGQQGHNMRTTISEMGPLLLSRMMNLNDIQSGILNIVFKIADEKRLLLIDIKDMRMMLDWTAKHAGEFTTLYGNISSQSIGAIQRALLTLESQGADSFFGEPSFNIYDLLQTESGKGVLNILAADKLMLSPKLYSTFLLWLLSELYEQLPEVGDLPQPKIVFFFDEAHMLFSDAPKVLIDKIEQVVRLVRSKGVGIFFITQSPSDIPETILGQLGNRIQHALRAYTPRDQKAVKVAAETFRQNPALNTEQEILGLGTGEALVSFLDEKGVPAMVQKAKMLFPLGQIGMITQEQRSTIIKGSRLYGMYERMIDRESAYELLTLEKQREEEVKKGEIKREEREKDRAIEPRPINKRANSPFDKAIGSAASSIGRQLGNELVRGVFGSLLKNIF